MNIDDLIKKNMAQIVEMIKAKGGITDERFNDELLVEINWATVKSSDVYDVWTKHMEMKIMKANNLEKLIDKI